MKPKPRTASVLDDLGNAQAPKGSREWLAFWIHKGKVVSEKLDDDASHMQRIIKLLEQSNAHGVLGRLSFEQLCREEFGLDAQQLETLKPRRGRRWNP